MSYLLDDLEKYAGWLVNREKKKRVAELKSGGEDYLRLRDKINRLESERDTLYKRRDTLNKKHDEAYQNRDLKKMQHNSRYADKAFDFATNREDRIRETKSDSWNKAHEVKQESKKYQDDFFGEDPVRRKDLERKEKMIVGIGGGLATAATAAGGAYLYSRYKKKKREQAEQEKTALLSDPDNLWKDKNKPPTLLNALKPKKPHGTTGTVPDYVKGTGRKQPSPLTDLINSRKRY